MDLWSVISLLLIALISTLLVLVRQIRLQRALRRLLARLLALFRSRSRMAALTLLCCALAGCDDRERQLRSWQQEQVAQVQRHAQQNADTTRALVSAQAESRHEFLSLERDLAQRRNTLETDRQAVAAARERVPLVANLLQNGGTIALGTLALLICGYLLVASGRADPSIELEEELLLELAGESTLLNPVTQALTSDKSPKLSGSSDHALELSTPTLAGPDTCPTS